MKNSNRKASSAEPDPPDAPSAGNVTNEVRENDRLKFKWENMMIRLSQRILIVLMS